MRQQAMMKIHFESGPSNLKNCTDKSKVLIMIVETQVDIAMHCSPPELSCIESGDNKWSSCEEFKSRI